MIQYEISVLQRLPNQLQKVLCFGHLTVCCEQDMEKERDWHEVTFKFLVSSYRVKDNIPSNPMESLLCAYSVIEQWQVGEGYLDGFVVGVTKWKPI